VASQIREKCWHLRWFFGILGAIAFLTGAAWLRQLPFSSEPVLYAYLQIVGSLLCFTYAANALVRFRGTHDRISLILALGFALAALVEAGGNFDLYSVFFGGTTLPTSVPLPWMVSRTVLGVLLLLALLVERRVPSSREPGKEILLAFLIVGGTAYLTSAAFLSLPWRISIHADRILARPWELVPAALFLAAWFGFRHRLDRASSAFDKALCWTALLNVICHIAASQSERLLDGPGMLAQVLKVASYGVLLGGALVENARLFEQVRQLAVSDSLTGLGNYRALLNALESEIQRSSRSGRNFAVILMDLDNLKQINDRHGHLVGSRAICRLGQVLRMHSRAIDTAARYGGDEFALVLPEAGAPAAKRVGERIRERLSTDGEDPAVTVSVGTAVFPQDGQTIEALFTTADRALYGMKGRGAGMHTLARIAACL